MLGYYFAAVERAARRGGVDTEALLQKHGIDRAILDHPGWRLPVETFSAFCDDIWQQMEDEYFGLSGQPCRPGSFAFLAEQCMKCQDLRQVLEKAITFYKLFTGIEMRLNEVGDQVELELNLSQPELDPEHILKEFLLITWHRFASWLIGNQVILSRADLSYSPPEHVCEYQFLLPGPHQFDQASNSLVFSSHFLAQPVQREATELNDFMRNFPCSVLVQPQNDDSHSARVRMLVKQSAGYPETLPDFDTISDQMHLTASTLRRKLKAEGSSYQQIKDMLRRDMAISHMQSDSMSIADIAAEVGFTEPGAFIRAFKNWTGYTPGNYRSASMAS